MLVNDWTPVLPGFQWVKNRLPDRLELCISLEIKGFQGVQVQPSAVKVDGDLHVLAIAETVGVFFTVWIFEFSPSLAALVMRWSQ